MTTETASSSDAPSLLAQTKQVNDTDIEIFHVNLDDSFDGLTKKAENRVNKWIQGIKHQQLY
jgi:hypothetical protein